MYPVDLGNDGSNSGLAANKDDALRIAREIYSGPEWDPDSIAVELTDREIGSVYRSRGEIEAAYADEISEGWADIQQVYGGWKVRAHFWQITARETGT